MIAVWIKLVIGMLKNLFGLADGLQKQKAQESAEDAGAAKAEAATLAVITERADAQTQINAMPRDARSVGGRLLRSEDGP